MAEQRRLAIVVLAFVVLLVLVVGGLVLWNGTATTDNPTTSPNPPPTYVGGGSVLPRPPVRVQGDGGKHEQPCPEGLCALSAHSVDRERVLPLAHLAAWSGTTGEPLAVSPLCPCWWEVPLRRSLGFMLGSPLAHPSR